MKKKFLALLLSFCMIFSMAPMAFATGSVPEGRSMDADSLAEAIENAADGEIITLENDVTVTSAVTIGENQNIILDLGGHTLSREAENVIVNNGTLTVRNGVVKMTGSGDYVNESAVVNNGTMTLENTLDITSKTGDAVTNNSGTLITAADMSATFNGGGANRGGGIFILDGDVKITGGTITAMQYALTANAAETAADATATVADGVTLQGYRTPIYWPIGTLTLGTKNGDGPTVVILNDTEKNNTNLGTPLEIAGGTVNVYSGTYTGKFQEKTDDQTWMTMQGANNLGDAITIYTRRAESYGPLTLNIYGGTFTSEHNYAIRYLDLARVDSGVDVNVSLFGGTFNSAGDKEVIHIAKRTDSTKYPIVETNIAAPIITGGDFSNDVSAYVPENYICAQNGDTWTVSELNAENAVAEVNGVYYKTLSDAVTAATEQTADNVTVNLLKDAALDGSYTLKTTKSIVLDLGGNTITDGRLNLYQGNLTIKNGKIQPDKTTQPINVYGAKETTGGDSALTIADNVKIDADYALCVFPEAGASNKYGYNVKVDVYGNLTGAQGGVFVSGNIGGDADVNADMRKHPDRIPVINIHDGAVVSGADTDQGIALNGLAVVNIYDGAAVTGREAVGVKSGVLNVLGGTLTAVGAAMDPATANNNGTEQTGAAISITSTYSKYGPIDVTVDAGTVISQNGTALYLGHSAQGEPSVLVPYGHTVTVDVTGGHFSGEKAAVYLAQPIAGDADYDTKTVSGGYFSADVSDFVKEDFAALPGSYVIDGITYQYLVDEPLPADVEVVNGAPEVNVPSADELGITEEEKAALDAAVQDISCDGLTAQANEVAATPEAFPTGEEALSQFKEGLPEGADAVSTDSVTTVVVPRLEVTVKAYQADGQTLTLDIKAVYDIKATTDAKNMKEAGDVENKDVNTVTLKKNAGILDTTGSAVVISVPLPTNFVNDTTVPVYVTHSKDGKDSGDRYVYRAALSEVGGVYTATFTNVHGFSIFDFALETGASITDENGETTYYATLQEAVDAVQNGQTIVLLKDKQNATVTRTVTFTVQSEAGKGYTETITAGAGTTGGKGEDGRYSFTYTRPSQGGSGGVAEPTYAVNVEPSVNGTISVSPAGKAKEDQTVTITVQPDNGYVLDEITVTDQNGNAIEVRLSETKYVFTMPKGEVTVKAAFKESAEVSGLPFTDVAVNSWYYDAIKYVYENGMMNGTEATLFSPNAATTRGMIVTILYRVEKEPAASDSQFTDVAAEAYYADAIGWAAENNIVTGDGDGKFRPNDEISREELSAILYRYAEMKGEDMSKLADLSGFVDADQIQAYAREAMAWANGAGLILGQPGNLLDPQGDATRAEVATILTRYFGSFGQLA